MLERKQVVFTDSSDPSFGDDAIEEVYIIGDLITLEIYEGCEWSFRYITGRTADGKPLIDLGKCKRFDLTMEVPGDIPVDEILMLTVWDLARMFATNKKTVQ